MHQLNGIQDRIHEEEDGLCDLRFFLYQVIHRKGTVRNEPQDRSRRNQILGIKYRADQGDRRASPAECFQIQPTFHNVVFLRVTA